MVSHATLREILAETAAKHGIPGLAAAAYCDNGQSVASFGVLNIQTGVEVTNESIFQIGSITKPFTATLVMQLVDEGSIELNDPIRRHLPWLQIAGQTVSDEITVRHLLSHTSGIDGDFFVDTGRNDDAIARFVDRAGEIPAIAPAGNVTSYSNTAYVILGRLIEVVTAQRWGDRLHKGILKPLACMQSCNDPEESPQFRVANGHTLDIAGGLVQLATPSFISRSMEPAGSRLMMSAADLARFGWMHLQGGIGQSKRRVLEAATAVKMRATIGRQPVETQSGTDFGLGWMLFNDWHPFAFGHDGSTKGQTSFLRIIPQWNFVLALLTNASEEMRTKDAFEFVLDSATRGFGNLRLPVKPSANLETAIPSHFVCGTYESVGERIEVTDEFQDLKARIVPKRLQEVGKDETRGNLITVDSRRAFFDANGMQRLFTFVGDDCARGADYLSVGYRLLPRLA